MDPAPRHAAVRFPASARLRNAGLLVVYLTALAQLARSWIIVDGRGSWPWYLGLFAVYLILFTLTVLRPSARTWRSHAELAVECLVVLALLSIDPELDFLAALFVPLGFAAALLFTGRARWYWVAALGALIAGSLMLYLGPLRGLALALVSVAAEIVFAAYVVVALEREAARQQSETMLAELESTHGRLQDYAAQAGELAAEGERDRVARDLNDSVATTVTGILAAAGAARAVLAAPAGAEDGAARADAAPLLAALQADTQRALAEMRGLIAELRPKSG